MRITRLRPRCLTTASTSPARPVDGPMLPVLARFAVPGLVDGDDAIVDGERVELVLPVLAVAAPAVQEDEGRITLTADVVGDRQAVGAAGRSLDRLVVGEGHWRKEQQGEDGQAVANGSRRHGCLPVIVAVTSSNAGGPGKPRRRSPGLRLARNRPAVRVIGDVPQERHQVVRTAKSPPRVLAQAAQADRFQVRRHLDFGVDGGAGSCELNCSSTSPRRGPGERRPAGQQLVQDHAQAVDIRVRAGFRVRVPNQLGGQVAEAGRVGVVRGQWAAGTGRRSGGNR